MDNDWKKDRRKQTEEQQMYVSLLLSHDPYHQR